MVVKKLYDQSPQSVAKIREETSKLSQVSNHPHVIRLIGFCDSMGALVMEYAPNGSAEDVLVKKKQLTGRDDIPTVIQVFHFLIVFIVVLVYVLFC